MSRPTGAAPTTLWLDPGFGAAGDMILGALLGLGAELDEVRSALGRLAVDGWSIERTEVRRSSLQATRAQVTHAEGHHHRTWSSIDGMLAAAELPERVRVGARATFRRLGEVEAAMHGVEIDEVHFHEVGAVDAIVDIVGCWLALDQLTERRGVDRVVSGPAGLGHGTIEAAHGTLPLPAPATARLLHGAPVVPLDLRAETVTPTGAALLTTMADRWGPIPAGVLVDTARGAGGRDPEGHPNVVTAHLVADAPAVHASPSDPSAAGSLPAGDPEAQRVEAVVLETNLDDVTPELVGHLIGRCLDAGADDAWAQPIVMKKSRPGFVFRVLCRPESTAELQQIVFAETGSLGIRVAPVAKDVLDRRFETVEIRGCTVRIKIGPYGAKPEYDDLADASRRLGMSIKDLAREALDAARRDDAE